MTPAVRLFVWFVIFQLIITVISATKCEFCGREYTCLNRHAWRCPIKATATAQQANNPPTPVHQPVSMPTTQPAHPLAEAPPAVVTCVCRRVCKGRKGLTMHQRSCAVLRSLHDQHTTAADRPAGAEVDVNEYPALYLTAADCTIRPQQKRK